MAKILQYPKAKELRQKALPVTEFDRNLAELIQEMKQTLEPDKGKFIGVGLAANQIGILKRVFLATMPDGEIEAVVNPEIIKAGAKMLSDLPRDQQFLEGCLSLPGYYGFVDRPVKIKVRYFTAAGKLKERTLSYPHSSYFQHERDHLDGILFIDYVKKNKEKLYLADKNSGKLQEVKNPF